VGDRHEIPGHRVVENRALTLDLGDESMGGRVVLNFRHDRAPINVLRDAVWAAKIDSRERAAGTLGNRAAAGVS
jgi:hypothetical protein